MSLGNSLLRRLLETARLGPHVEAGRFVLVLDGAGLEGASDRIPYGAASWTVVRPETELQLRRYLWQAAGSPLLAIVPEALALTLARRPDLLLRAHGHRVHALQLGEVLSAALEVRVQGTDDPALQQLALARIPELKAALVGRTTPTVIDRNLLEELLCEVQFGAAFRTATPGELLAAWLAEDPSQWEEGLRTLVRSRLGQMHGTEGRVLGWALAQGSEALRGLVVHGILLELPLQELPDPAWGPLAAARTDPAVGSDVDALRQAIVRLCHGALDVLDGKGASGPLLTAAETLARHIYAPSARARLRALPLGLDEQIAALAGRAARGEVVSAAEVRAAGEHRAARNRAGDLRVLDEMARLSRYLASPPASEAPLRHYGRDGAFADLCALRLRRLLGEHVQLQSAAAAVLDAWRRRRDEENARWAAMLAADYHGELMRHATAGGPVPLHRVARQLVAPALADGDRVFLCVLDGCSMPVFLDLLHGLLRRDGSEQSSRAIGVDHGAHFGMSPQLSPIGIAPLPTITSHARGALFLGRMPADPFVAEDDNRRREAQTDPARLQANADLQPWPRKLFLKGNLADGGAGLRAALADAGLPLVAAVFNAIDDQLGSSNTHGRFGSAPEDIAGLLPALDAALDAGRRVLLTADHGHTPFLALTHRAGAGSSPRFCPIGEGEPPAGYVAIELGESGALSGGHGPCAFASRVGAYLGQPQVGFHGGCGLEEMAVPLVWLRRGGTRLNEPAWWSSTTRVAEPLAAWAEDDATLPGSVGAVVPSAPGAEPPSPPSSKRRQIDLLTDDFGGEARTVRLVAAGVGQVVVDALDSAEVTALDLLLRNRSATVSDLAHALGRPPARVQGFMARLLGRLGQQGLRCVDAQRSPSGEQIYHWLGPTGPS